MPPESRIASLLREAGKCCEILGLRVDAIERIYRSDNDWEFILKAGALLETAAKEVIRNILKLETRGVIVGGDDLDPFVSSLPMNGRTSLLQLLRASNCDRDICDFIESVRYVRNAFAHNIRHVDASLLAVIQTRKDWSSILHRLSPIENYDEADWLRRIMADGGLLRFAILHHLLIFMTLAYHVALKEPARLDLTTLGD